MASGRTSWLTHSGWRSRKALNSEKYFSGGTQRLTMAAVPEVWPMGNSLHDEADLAGIDEFLLHAGEHVASGSCAQWGQVSEAYSMTVIGALGLPSARSPSGPSAISSATGGPFSALSAATSADPATPPQPASATPTASRRSDRWPSHRVACPGCLLGWRGRPFGLGCVSRVCRGRSAGASRRARPRNPRACASPFSRLPLTKKVGVEST